MSQTLTPKPVRICFSADWRKGTRYINPNNQQQSTNNKYIVTKGQINYDYQIYDRQETEYSL